MRRAWLVLVAAARTARAAPADSWSVTAEAGAEVDTNIQRVETGPGLPDTPISAPVARLGVRVDGRDHALGGGYVLALSDLTRIVAEGDSQAQVENVTLLAGDLRWLHPIGDRPVSFGAGVTAADALPLSDPVGDRTFSLVGADLLLSARAGDDHRLLLAVGGRSFVYKPVTTHDYDWTGPTAMARLDLVLWQPAERTRSLELATTLGFEARDYDAVARTNVCPPGAPPDPTCFAASDLARRDRFTRAAVELTWAGSQVVTLGYQLFVTDSNSFGESLVRHRVLASGTTALPGGLYGTLLGILEIDQYSDGLIVRTDLVRSDFANIEDENTSSIQARLAKKLSHDWSLEGRAAIWRNLAGASMNLEFHRELVYLGLVYAR
jgi:hypothetical protein